MIKTKTVSTRQFAFIIFIVAISSKIFMLPALIMGISGRDSWLTLLCYFAIELMVLLFILFASKKNPDLTVYDLLKITLGKIGSKIVLSLIVIFYLFKTTVMIGEIKVFFVITATESLSWQLCVIPLLVSLGFMSIKSLRSIGRVSEIMLPLLVAAFAVLGIIMVKNTDFTNLMPFFENGISNNLYSFLLLPIWLTDFSVLTIFLGRVENNKKVMRASLISISISFVIILYFNVVMFSTYSYAPNLLDYGHNVTNMLLYPTGTYNYGRFDLVIFSIWMIGIMIHIVLLFYTTCRHIKNIIGIKRNYVIAIINTVIIYILVEIIFPDEFLLYSYSVSVFNYFAFVVEIIFPSFIFIASFIAHRKHSKRGVLLNEI